MTAEHSSSVTTADLILHVLDVVHGVRARRRAGVRAQLGRLGLEERLGGRRERQVGGGCVRGFVVAVGGEPRKRRVAPSVRAVWPTQVVREGASAHLEPAAESERERERLRAHVDGRDVDR